MVDFPKDHFQDYLVRALAIIEEHGHLNQAVLPDDDLGRPAFVYTVGLVRVGLPDLLMVGLPFASAQAILNDIVDRMIAGYVPDVNVGCPGFLQDGYELVFTELSPAAIEADFGVAKALDLRPERALQVWFPDKEGRNHGDLLFDATYLKGQTLIPEEDLP